VASDYQGKGIGGRLWRGGLKESQKADNCIREFAVHSSPYAMPIYEKLGFRAIASEQLCNGLRFVPMMLRLSPS
jgi:ribosomal protein S18 acetylase RimI-like enzyme